MDGSWVGWHNFRHRHHCHSSRRRHHSCVWLLFGFVLFCLKSLSLSFAAHNEVAFNFGPINLAVGCDISAIEIDWKLVSEKLKNRKQCNENCIINCQQIILSCCPSHLSPSPSLCVAFRVTFFHPGIDFLPSIFTHTHTHPCELIAAWSICCKCVFQ